MGKRKFEEDEDGKMDRKKRQAKWTQEETDFLCELLLTHGALGIMAKTTNAATKERKKQEWTTIGIAFNSNSVVCFFPIILAVRPIELLCIFFSHAAYGTNRH